MNEHALKRIGYLLNLKLRLNIFKDKISELQKLQISPNNTIKSNNHKADSISKQDENESKIPQFMTLSKLEWDNNEIHAGVIKDPTAKGGLRYMVIEPVLSERDQRAFEIIKKLLMTELSVSLQEIKSKKDAERRLKKKIASMIKKYRLNIPKKNIAKINYYAIRDFVHLGKIEPLMRDHMIEEISCDGTNIPIYIWHREHESMPTNIIFEKDVELNNFSRKMAYICGKHVSMADPFMDLMK